MKTFFQFIAVVGFSLFGFTAIVSGTPSTSLVLSQIYGGGGNAGASYRYDFVELHNVSATSQSITGWSLQVATETGSVWSKLNLSGSVQAGGYFLIRLASSGSGGVALPAVDATGFLQINQTSAKVALVNSTTSLAGSNPVGDPTIIDFVGFGAADAYEGFPAAAADNTSSLQRGDYGAQDSDFNGMDFVLGVPAPRNSSTPPVLPFVPTTTCFVSVIGTTGADLRMSTNVRGKPYTGIVVCETSVNPDPYPGYGTFVDEVDSYDASAMSGPVIFRTENPFKNQSVYLYNLKHNTNYSARSFARDIYSGESYSAVVTFQTAPRPDPEIAVDLPTGVSLVDGSARLDFGKHNVETSSNVTLTISNDTTMEGLDLILGEIGKEGLHAGDFQISAPDTTTLAGSDSTFLTITFTPTDIGVHTATIHIISNDADESPFDITLTGNGVLPAQAFEAWATSCELINGDADPFATPHHDGVANLLKYSFNMDGKNSDVRMLSPETGTAGLPRIALDRSGPQPVLRFEYIRRKNCGIRYIPRKSVDLVNWNALASQPIVTDIDAEWDRVVVSEPVDSAMSHVFGRLETERLDAAESYASWIAGFDFSAFTNPNLTPEGDPDGDGLCNRDEYAFNLDPTSNASASVITVSVDMATGTFTYNRPVNTGLTYTVWYSTDPWTSPERMSWVRDVACWDVVVSGGNVETVQVTMSIFPGWYPRLWVQVRAAE